MFETTVLDRGVEAQVVFYAAGPSQAAFQSSDDHLSYFTDALIEGLEGDPAALVSLRGVPCITVASLLSFVQPKVAARAASAGRTQRPELMPPYHDHPEAVVAEMPGRTSQFPPVEVWIDSKENPPPRLHLKVQTFDMAKSAWLNVSEASIEGTSGSVPAPMAGYFRVSAYPEPGSSAWGTGNFDPEVARRVQIKKLQAAG